MGPGGAGAWPNQTSSAPGRPPDSSATGISALVLSAQPWKQAPTLFSGWPLPHSAPFPSKQMASPSQRSSGHVQGGQGRISALGTPRRWEGPEYAALAGLTGPGLIQDQSSRQGCCKSSCLLRAPGM